MNEQSESGLKTQKELNPLQKAQLLALGFPAIAHDLQTANLLEIRPNSKLIANGPSGVIVFIPNAIVGKDGLIEFPITKELESVE